MSNLEEIRDKIEAMSTYNQIEILKIFNRHKNITLNENKNGTLVNLTDISEEIIKELLTFILYVETQEKNLNETELKKEEFKNIYFAKDNKGMASY
jgi:hypothetical protein